MQRVSPIITNESVMTNGLSIQKLTEFIFTSSLRSRQVSPYSQPLLSVSRESGYKKCNQISGAKEQAKQ